LTTPIRRPQAILLKVPYSMYPKNRPMGGSAVPPGFQPRRATTPGRSFSLARWDRTGGSRRRPLARSRGLCRSSWAPPPPYAIYPRAGPCYAVKVDAFTAIERPASRRPAAWARRPDGGGVPIRRLRRASDAAPARGARDVLPQRSLPGGDRLAKRRDT